MLQHTSVPPMKTKPFIDPQAKREAASARGLALWNKRFAGKPVATKIGADGYLYIRLDGQRLRLDYVVWCHQKGAWPTPDQDIEHIDGDKANCRLENLRLVDKAKE